MSRYYGLLLMLLLPLAAESANILGMFTSLSPSHMIIHMEMMKTLAENGHNVTMVTVVPPPHPIAKIIHHIYIPMSEEGKREFKSTLSELSKTKITRYSMGRWWKILKMCTDQQVHCLTHPKFTALYEQKFDLVFLGYFLNLYELGVAAKLNCPIILNWVGSPHDQMDELTGNPIEISYVPPSVLPPAEDYSLLQRLQMLFMHWNIRFQEYRLNNRMQQHYERIFANERNFPSFAEVKKRISLVFSNYYSLTEGPIRPLVPSYIEVGGLQVKEQPNELPADMKEFLDTAKHGAILLSLGTNVKGSFIKPKVLSVLYDNFSKLKQRVIWKWDDLSKVPGNASNILFKEWLPQDDILAHPNIRLFITHAGKGGIAEAQYHGVPMLSFPFFGDQFANTEAMVKSGFGLGLTFETLQNDEFANTIKELLENDKYSNAIKKYAQLYRDRPMTSRQAVLYWTEYVLRHKGAYHLQSPWLHMTTIERHNLDVYALIGLIIFIFFWLLKSLLSWLCTKYQKNTVKIKKH